MIPRSDERCNAWWNGPGTLGSIAFRGHPEWRPPHGMKIRVIQNCFQPAQRASCVFEPYLNEIPRAADERYLFFESEVIRKLVTEGRQSGFEYFGVLGHRWRDKLREARAWGIPLRNMGRDEPTPDGLVRFIARHPEADFLSLGRFLPHPVFRVAEKCHPGLWMATERLLEILGIRFDLRRDIPHPIYFNSFIGKSRAVEAYVGDLLAPAIEAATQDAELRRLCFRDPGYFRPFPSDLAELFGIDHYPLHPFLGERLINIHILLTGSRVASFDRNEPGGLASKVVAPIPWALRRIHCRWRVWRWLR